MLLSFFLSFFFLEWTVDFTHTFMQKPYNLSCRHDPPLQSWQNKTNNLTFKWPYSSGRKTETAGFHKKHSTPLGYQSSKAPPTFCFNKESLQIHLSQKAIHFPFSLMHDNDYRKTVERQLINSDIWFSHAHSSPFGSSTLKAFAPPPMS